MGLGFTRYGNAKCKSCKYKTEIFWPKFVQLSHKDVKTKVTL
jgi:hypothetical protein